MSHGTFLYSANSELLGMSALIHFSRESKLFNVTSYGAHDQLRRWLS